MAFEMTERERAELKLRLRQLFAQVKQAHDEHCKNISDDTTACEVEIAANVAWFIARLMRT